MAVKVMPLEEDGEVRQRMQEIVELGGQFSLDKVVNLKSDRDTSWTLSSTTETDPN